MAQAEGRGEGRWGVSRPADGLGWSGLMFGPKRAGEVAKQAGAGVSGWAMVGRPRSSRFGPAAAGLGAGRG